MKSLVAIIVSAVVMAFAGAAIAAEDAPQPLTRAACEQAGMKWNDRANVCGIHKHHEKKKAEAKKEEGQGQGPDAAAAAAADPGRLPAGRHEVERPRQCLRRPQAPRQDEKEEEEGQEESEEGALALSRSAGSRLIR